MSSAAALPRVFLACAPQDLKFTELIITRARGDRLPIEFERMGEGRTDEVGWQMECRRRIRSSRVLVVCVGPHTGESARVKWQVQCARELGLSVVGISIGFEEGASDGVGAPVDAEASIVGWKWKTISSTLLRFLVEPSTQVWAARFDGSRRTRLTSHDSAA